MRDDDSLIDLGAATHLELLSYLNNIMQAIGISSKVDGWAGRARVGRLLQMYGRMQQAASCCIAGCTA